MIVNNKGQGRVEGCGMDVQRERLSITYGLPLHAVCFDELP